ncbi:MAG: hypothetical protein ACFB10_21085 [Salibacteraceae bacterium]
MAKVKLLSVLLVVALFTACAPGTMPARQFANWCDQPENGLVKARQLSGLNFTLTYQPQQLVAWRNQDTTRQGQGFDGWEYYHLKIGRQGSNRELLKELATTPESYQQLVNHLSFQFQKGISLQAGDTQLPCLHYHFERTYGLSPEVDLVFAFKNTDPEFEQNRRITIEDPIFGTGILNFQLQGADLQTAQAIEIY